VQVAAAAVVPSAMLGMLGLTGLLLLLDQQTSAPLVQFYDDHISWTITLLPLLYSPALAVLPSMLLGMPGKRPRGDSLKTATNRCSRNKLAGAARLHSSQDCSAAAPRWWRPTMMASTCGGLRISS
jgi:hypothetical protein